MITNSDTKKLDKDTFRFVLPAELEKAADGSYKVRGLASTEKVDQQGEVIIQKGVDLTPIDKKKGVLNWDHQRGPENTIGILDGYQRTANGLFIEGRLFKNHTKAKAVREIMESLGEGDRGRMGLSVEGRILERDPLNPSVIRKCQISAVALTMNPVNSETYADIVKSMNAADVLEIDAQEENSVESKEEPTFTASQVMAIVQKALSVGAGSMGPPSAKVGGDALQPSDMKAEKLEKCSKCGKQPCACVKKAEEDADGSVFSSKPMAVEKASKKKMKKMDKCLYKSNLLLVLDKLQVLYPDHSRSEIWEAVKERLETKFDIQKGGPGSGKKGHVTVRSKDYHWGTMRHVETDHQTVPIHPEHWEKMKNVHEGHKDIDHFKDETGKNWKVSRHPEGGVHLEHDSIAGKFSHHVGKEHMKELDSKEPTIQEMESIREHHMGKDSKKPSKSPERAKLEDEADRVTGNAVQSWDQHSDDEIKEIIADHSKTEKGLRLKNTSGKEREHKLYEDARQREDYERNKDKSRAELNQLAEESGASKHDKQKIRAQRDAAIQAGEDRDHVRPNVKG